MGSALPNAPLRLCQVHTRTPRRIVGKGLSESNQLSGSVHSDHHNSSHLSTTPGADAGRRIRTFRNVVYLHIGQHTLAPFHGLSPTVKSLRLDFRRARLSEVFDLMCSFPLLDDFSFFAYGYEEELDGWTAPPTSPRLTGSLELRIRLGSTPSYVSCWSSRMA